MKKISSIIQHFKSNPLTRLEKYLLLLIIVVLVISIAVSMSRHDYKQENKQLKNTNKEIIKQSLANEKQSKKEIEKLKKDVVLHTILADSSIARANRLSKKQINNELAFSKIDSIVSSYSNNEIELFWLNRKNK